MKNLFRVKNIVLLLVSALMWVSCNDDEKGDDYPLLPVKSQTAQASDAQVVLKWTAPTSDYVKEYTITWMPDNGSTTVKSGTTTYTAANLKNGTEYTFSIAAVYDRGKSEVVTVKATPKQDVVVYEPCTDLQSVVGNQKVTLSWTVPVPAAKTELTGYKISVLPKDVEDITINDPKLISQVIEGLTNGKEYTCSLVATYKGGESPAVTIKGTPKAPTYVPCSNPSTSVGDQTITLTWTAPKPEAGTELSGYKISVLPKDAEDITINDPKLLSRTITGLTNGKEYTFSLVATYKGGESAGVSAKATPVATPVVPGFDPAEITGEAIPEGWERLNSFNEKEMPKSMALYHIDQWDGQPVNAYVVMWNKSSQHKVYGVKTPEAYSSLRGKVTGEPTIVLAGTESPKSIVVSNGKVIIDREGEGAGKSKCGLSLNKDGSWEFDIMTTVNHIPYYNSNKAKRWETQEAFCSGNKYLDAAVPGGIVDEAGVTDKVQSISFVGYYHNEAKNADIAALLICQKEGSAVGMSIKQVSTMFLSMGLKYGCQVTLGNSVGLEINSKAVFNCSNDLYYILSLSETAK